MMARGGAPILQQAANSFTWKVKCPKQSQQTLPLPFLSADICVAPCSPNESAALVGKGGEKNIGQELSIQCSRWRQQ